LVDHKFVGEKFMCYSVTANRVSSHSTMFLKCQVIPKNLD